METIEIQAGGSASQEPDLTDRQRLIFNRDDERPVKERLDKILAEHGVSLDSQRMPGDRFRRNR